MDLSIKTESFSTDDKSWLGSQHGTDATRTITLDTSAFTAATHYPKGYVPSGMSVGKITATGLYGPYDDTASDGREVLAGHLYSGTAMTAGSSDVGAALLEHGFVIEAKLPTNHGLDADGKTDVAGRIFYR